MTLLNVFALTPSRSELRKCLKKLFQKSQHFFIQKILTQFSLIIFYKMADISSIQIYIQSKNGLHYMMKQTLSYTFVPDTITIRVKEVPQKAVSKKPALFHTKKFDPIFIIIFYKMADISSIQIYIQSKNGLHYMMKQTLSYTFVPDTITIRVKEVPQKAV
jgi:hypothetical protein